MSILQQFPEILRSVGTRLKPVFQFRIWASVGVLSVVGIFLWQYSQNPEWFTLEEEEQTVLEAGTEPTDDLTPEERAIAAEIDSSGFLEKELKKGQLSDPLLNQTLISGEGLTKLPQNSQSDSSKRNSDKSNPFLQDLKVDLSVLNPVENSGLGTNSTLPNSNSDSTKLLLNNTRNRQNSLDPTSSKSSTNNSSLTLFPSSSEETEDTEAKSPLQAAMDQFLQVKPDSSASETDQNSVTSPTVGTQTEASLTPDNGTLNPTTPLTPITEPLVSSPGVTGQVNQPSWSVPRTSQTPTPANTPAPAYNPYQTTITIPQAPTVPTVPTAPSQTPNLNLTPNGSGTSPYSANVYSPNTGSGYGNVQQAQPNNYIVNPSLNPNLPRTQQVQPDTPFTTPNRVPGRYIGGGEINTFANP